MKTVNTWGFVINLFLWLISLVRICMGKGEVHDYVVVFFTSDFLVYDIYKIIQRHIERKKSAINKADGASAP